MWLKLTTNLFEDMRYYKLLLLSLISIVCYIVMDYVISQNSSVQINYIQGLEYNSKIHNMSIGDTIAFGGSAIYAENIEERMFYFYEGEGRKVYVKDTPLGKHQRKQEFYVVNNYKWKGRDAICNEIAAFNSKTISLDSVRKYNAGYSRFFLLKKGGMSEGYQYSGEGDFIGSADYSKCIVALYEWEISIKEAGDIFDGEIGDSILIARNIGFCNMNDRQKVDSILKH